MSGRQIFQNSGWFYRLVGARGATSATAGIPLPSENGNKEPNKDANFGTIYHGVNAAREIAQHRVVFFGEIHSRPAIVSFQRMVQEKMAKEEVVPPAVANHGVLHVVFEHFSFDMQDLLDAYQEDKLSFNELVEKYQEIGTEGHDLEPYRDLLEDAKYMNTMSAEEGAAHRKVKLHAGFLSRKYARMLMKEGKEAVWKEVGTWLPPLQPDLLKGTEYHYNIFESLLTGRLIGSATEVDDRFRKIFQAQVFKDVAMAHKINTLLAPSPQENIGFINKSDKILVLAGNGHILGYSGVPERVLQEHPELSAETCVLISHHSRTSDPQTKCTGIETSSSLEQNILEELQETNSNLADYVYVYREQPKTEPGLDKEQPTAQGSLVSAKQETQEAYDRIGESAHIKGNAAKAIAIMTNMKYSKQQIAVAGGDVHNFQGVGNPHLNASIKPGETVLDVGSGLGIDSYIAYEAAMAGESQKGFVLGIDISGKEVRHAQSCAQRRNLPNIRFSQADMEQIPLPDNSVDVVISNGAFCLAPDKEKAFTEVFRVLKPGGRISICTTTTQDENKLEPGVSWPVCMKMFYPKNELVPLCEKIGYVNVFVDDSDSSMSMELPIEVLENDEGNPNSPSQQRNKVHVGSPEFNHLEDYDMDALCARVCVVAQKPA